MPDAARTITCDVRFDVPRVDITGIVDGEPVRLLGAAVHGAGGPIRNDKRLDSWLRSCTTLGMHVRCYLLLTVDADTFADVWVEEWTLVSRPEEARQ